MGRRRRPGTGRRLLHLADARAGHGGEVAGAGRRGPPARGAYVVRDVGLYGRLLRQARPYWLHIAALFALGLLASPIALLNPVPLRIVVDSVLGSRPLPPLLRALVPASVGSSAAATLALAIGLLLAVTALGQLPRLATALLRTYLGARPV